MEGDDYWLNFIYLNFKLRKNNSGANRQHFNKDNKVKEAIQKYRKLHSQGMSKADVVRQIANDNLGLNRRGYLDLLQQSLDQMPATASTYYQKYLNTGQKSQIQDTKPLKKATRDVINLGFSSISKSEFVREPLIKKYISHVSSLVLGATFKHSYKDWSCQSFSEAKLKYYWHGSFEDNNKRLEHYSLGLKSALLSQDENQTLYWCIKILDWGKVYRECISFILIKFEQGTLCKTISDSISILDADNYQLEQFDQSNFRMDSGMTKIYSLGSKRSIILDSRVAAAMFMLASQIFTKDELRYLERKFIFIGGSSTSTKRASKRRETSSVKSLHILKPYLDTKQFPLQAHVNLLSNWILQQALENAESKNSASVEQTLGKNGGSLRAIEAALFMVGADISTG